MISCCIQRARKIFFESENRGQKDCGYSLIQSCAPKVKAADTVCWLTFSNLHGTVFQKKKTKLRMYKICHVNRNSHKNYVNFIYSGPAVIKTKYTGSITSNTERL
jgi:hypothetical protein